MKIDPYLFSCTKLKSKWIIKPDILTWIEKEMGNSHECIDTGDNFLNRISVLQTLIN